MKRRKFLKVGIVLLAAGIGGGIIIPNFRRTIRTIIKRDTRYLSLQPGSIDKFLREASINRLWKQFSFSKKLLLMGHTFGGIFRPLLPYHNKYIQYKGQISGHFLLSTDFFIHKMDEKREVEYTQFYNPYNLPCYNPFSSIFYSEKA